MGLEEQQEELQVLQSIYPDEITIISDSEYRISILLDTDPSPQATEPPTLILGITLPPNYPSAAPSLTLLPPPSAAPHPHFSLAHDRAHLLSLLAPLVLENAGQAMVFALVSQVKEGAEALIAQRVAAAEAAAEGRRRAEEEREESKFVGEPVTAASFRVWQEAFLKEAEGERAREEEARRGGKLSGRELWERGLARGGEGEGEEEVEAEGVLVAGVGALGVGA
ncbi:MAG: hypothetical protein M1829_001711 [Trizodia sp. TS-e1964]|nr:MAG: hypothetical protein M1829_001711 [Trizodia sp. TS-e1964]